MELISLILGFITTLICCLYTDHEYNRDVIDASLKARKPTLWRHAWIQLITQYINVVSLPTHIHNSPIAWGPPPLELSVHVNEKPKFRTRVLEGSVRVFPLTSRTTLITCSVAPSFITKSVVWTKPWTEEQTNTQCVVNIGDTLSEIPPLPANIKFESEAILSEQVVFQLNSDYCTKVVITGGLHCIILYYEARLCFYKDAISLNSQAGQWNTGTCHYGQLKHAFFKKGNFTSFQSVHDCLSIYRLNVSLRFHHCCLVQLSLPTFKLPFLQEHESIYVTWQYTETLKFTVRPLWINCLFELIQPTWSFKSAS